MQSAEDESQGESKLQQAGVDAVAGGAAELALQGIADAASTVLSGAVDILSGAGQIAVDCGGAAVQALGDAAGSVLDGL